MTGTMILCPSYKLISLGTACFFFPLFTHPIQRCAKTSAHWQLEASRCWSHKEKEVGEREAIGRTNRPRLAVIVPKDKVRPAEVLFVGKHSLTSRKRKSSVFLGVISDGLLTRAGPDSRGWQGQTPPNIIAFASCCPLRVCSFYHTAQSLGTW